MNDKPCDCPLCQPELYPDTDEELFGIYGPEGPQNLTEGGWSGRGGLDL